MARDTTIFVPGEADSVERWEALWQRSPHRTVFSRLDYVASVAAATRLETAVVLVSRNGEDTAGAIVTWKRRGPYREVVLPPITPFSAVILSEDQAQNEVHGRTGNLERLLEALEQHFDVARLHLPTTVRDARPASWRGWEVRPFYTYMLPLPAEPSAWSGSVQRNFERERSRFDVVVGEDAASAVVHLCAAGYRRHGRRPPLEEEPWAEVLDSVREAGLATCYGVRPRGTGTVDAAVAVSKSGATASYWIAGSVPGPAMTVLIGEILTRLSAEGIKTFDFVGANTPGIAEFKRKFGSELTPYFGLVRCNRRELKLLYSIRSILR